jgi:hypothetical protein
MAYSNFTIKQVISQFGLKISTESIFENVPDLAMSYWLSQTLQNYKKIPLSSEKARGELIVSPILTEIKLLNDFISIHSGNNLEADLSLSLNGECDFILSIQEDLPEIILPVFGIVEAKKNDIDLGLGQCIAQMYGARILNERDNNGIYTIFGAVTTGEIWQFMKLEDQTVWIDERRYYIDRVERILGILQNIVDRYRV